MDCCDTFCSRVIVELRFKLTLSKFCVWSRLIIDTFFVGPLVILLDCCRKAGGGLPEDIAY